MDKKKSKIYSQLESGIPGGYVTHASQVEGLKESAAEAPILTQSIALAAGYNWISFYVETDLESVQNALGTNADSISTVSKGGTVTNDLISTYDAATGTWSGNLKSIDPARMFSLYMNTACTIEITGKKLNPEEIEIVLEPGWNLISYPFDKEMTVDEALKNFSPQSGDIFKAHIGGFSGYLSSSEGWFSTELLFTKPGLGYHYNNASSEARTVRYAVSETDAKIKAAVKECKEYVDVKMEKVKKSSISILFVGNSLTQDGIAYLPYMLKNYYPEIDFKIYMWYIGGKTLGEHYSNFISSGVADIFSMAENSESWTNQRNNTTMSLVLSAFTFDIVCMQEYFNYKTEYTAVTDWNNCRDYIVSNYRGGNALEFISLFHAPLRKDGFDVHEVYKRTEEGNALILQDTISEDMIPNGIAVYRALDTDLNSLGDLGQLSPDGTHTQEGLPCLLQTYVTLCWLFDRLKINKSIYGHPMRMTTDIYDTISVPGANLGTGVVQGTDAQYLLAQEVAIKAYKEGRQFVTRNLYPYEWSGGSALIQCKFSIISNTIGATIKINGVEQSSVVVLGGSTVNWEVSKEGYETQTGSETVGSDTIKNVELIPTIRVSSISAQFNQGSRTIFDEQDLDDLREYLVVTANYIDGTSEETDDYVLSGTLTSGTSVVTVSFGGNETIFSVEVTAVVIPSDATRYDWIAYKNDKAGTSSTYKDPSHFIYLNAYDDMNQLSGEFIVGKKPNVDLISGAGLLGARLSSGTWYGMYPKLEEEGLRVDIKDHIDVLLPYPNDLSKFKVVTDIRPTSPAYAYINDRSNAVEIPWTTASVINVGMSLFNNIPDGATANMAFNFYMRIGEIKFRDFKGSCVGYYVPVVLDGKIGMYDVMSQTFCTAQTAAAVTVGNSDCQYKVGNW